MYVPNNITAKYVKQTNKSEWRKKPNLNYSWKLQLLFLFFFQLLFQQETEKLHMRSAKKPRISKVQTTRTYPV